MNSGSLLCTRDVQYYCVGQSVMLDFSILFPTRLSSVTIRVKKRNAKVRTAQWTDGAFTPEIVTCLLRLVQPALSSFVY